MREPRRWRARAAVAATLVVVWSSVRPAPALPLSVLPTGGAPLTAVPPQLAPGPRSTPAPGRRPMGRWWNRITITEYWPAPESWFVGGLVAAPGLRAPHRIDWLYSAKGMSMQGDGIGLDGRFYHLASLGAGGWITADGRPTGAGADWAGGTPYWRTGGYWRLGSGAVTFPLQAGGWSNGPGRRYVPLRGVRFAPGLSRPLTPYGSIAVDPAVIPLGSRVYIPAYQPDGRGGWFVAQDTGGAIRGRRIDVFRSPPASPTDHGQYLINQRVLVLRPANAR